MPGDYSPRAIEPKWQRYWEEHNTFRTPNPGERGFDPQRRKFYILDMFPYPSGAGLHVGHPEGYTATDIIARYRRMQGDHVLHPMGWDAFGLPAEQHAVETGQHPALTTERNVGNFRRQLKMLGFSYDWDREIATTDPKYYRWTQWIFLKLFNSWYDEHADKARPITELDIPSDIQAKGEKATQDFIDSHRLAYLAEVPVNWCPALGTVLSNEEVTNEGRSDRGNHPVYRRPMRQWMLRITKYADRLEKDLETLSWPESVKLMQRNWIGRSEGAQVRFRVDGVDDVLEIFTTRPDTLFGATYMVLAPEHPLVEKITTPEHRESVRQYCRAATQRSELARTAEAKEKTGVPTGGYAINPVFPEGDPRARIPVWVADYVLITYGTGAIMAVPAGDTRDFEFAKQFDLPIVPVVMPPEEWLRKQIISKGVDADYAKRRGRTDVAKSLQSTTSLGWLQEVCIPAFLSDPGLFCEAFTGEGTSMNSGEFDGLPSSEFKKKIVVRLEEKKLGCGMVNYKLRDWLFSRQRYWGEPFPILHGPDGEIVPLDESELPLTLPDLDDFRPAPVEEGSDASPSPPLGRAGDWCTVNRDGKTYRRELNTMPQWAGSCWYYLRFIDPTNDERLCSREAEQYWMVSAKADGTPHAGGIDLYLGGAEHAVLHLLYSRFWHKVLYDLGYISTPEPFGKLFNQGMIRAFAYTDSRGSYVGYDEIEFRDDVAYRKADGEKLDGAIEKMSKTLKNVINPEEVVRDHGADALRLYEMFMGPLDASKPWNPRDLPGVFRFLQRTWRLIAGDEGERLSSMVVDGDTNEELERVLHKTIKKVTEDIERMAFNTAISAMMEFVNEAYRVKTIHKSQAERFVLILSSFAPHLGEELWQRLRGDDWKESLAYASWPSFDPTRVVEAEVEVPIQINGKLVGRVTVAKDADEETVRKVALADEKVTARIGSAAIVKTIHVPGRMMNLIVK